jgi:hypothetical protein
MRKLIFFFLVVFSSIQVQSQELNCLVTVNSEQVQGSNKQVFTTLQKALSEYVNQTQWTQRTVTPEERINCAMNIIVTSRNNNNFEATLQIQSTRPVFGATYSTPVLNIKDNDFSFRYNEFDPLIYNENSFDSNLVSTIVFYVNIILGSDADTFKKNGGEQYLKEAQNVMLQAQQSGLAAWQNQVGKFNRFSLIDNMLSPKLQNYRYALYTYHRAGLDILSEDLKKGKQQIENTVLSLESIFNKSIGNNLIRLFFDAKSDEIVRVYSDGPSTRSQQRLLQTLRKISVNNNQKWGQIN